MLIRLLSDLHMEFRPLDIEPLPEDMNTVLVLAGDLHCGAHGIEFVEEAAKRFMHVIYILGNHEFYGFDINAVAPMIREVIKDRGLQNVTFLDNETLEFQGVRFIGSTMWSDMDKKNPLSMHLIEKSLNDYHVILRNGIKLRAPYTIALFDEAVAFIEGELKKDFDGPTVVVTHFAPSAKSIHPIYQESRINGAYCSDLDHLLHYYDIDYWFHGHTHQTVFYEVGGTKVRMNPFGYREVAENLNFDPLFRVEV